MTRRARPLGRPIALLAEWLTRRGFAERQSAIFGGAGLAAGATVGRAAVGERGLDAVVAWSVTAAMVFIGLAVALAALHMNRQRRGPKRRVPDADFSTFRWPPDRNRRGDGLR